MTSLSADTYFWAADNNDRLAREWEASTDSYEFRSYLSGSIAHLARALQSDSADVAALRGGLDTIRLLYSAVTDPPPQTERTLWQAEIVKAFVENGDGYAREQVEAIASQRMSAEKLLEAGLISGDTTYVLAGLIRDIAAEAEESLSPYSIGEVRAPIGDAGLAAIAEAYKEVALTALRSGHIIVRLTSLSALEPILKDAYRFANAKLTLALAAGRGVVFDQRVMERCEAAVSEPGLEVCVGKLKLLGKIMGERPEEEE